MAGFEVSTEVLARRGFVYREGTNWSTAHYAWLRRLAAASSPLVAEDQEVFGEYLALLEYKLSRRDALDHRIGALALTPALAPAVNRLQCFRGVQRHVAMVLTTEIGDWRRFGSPRQLMAYLGLVPKERSSGDRERRGSLTKAGAATCSSRPPGRIGSSRRSARPSPRGNAASRRS